MHFTHNQEVHSVSILFSFTVFLHNFPEGTAERSHPPRPKLQTLWLFSGEFVKMPKNSQSQCLRKLKLKSWGDESSVLVDDEYRVGPIYSFSAVCQSEVFSHVNQLQTETSQQLLSDWHKQQMVLRGWIRVTGCVYSNKRWSVQVIGGCLKGGADSRLSRNTACFILTF